MIKNRSMTEPPQKPRRRMLRKNSKVKHYQFMMQQENTLHDQVVKLTMKAIQTNAVSNMTPFISHSASKLQENIYTKPAYEKGRNNLSSFISFQSSQIHSKDQEDKIANKGKTIFDRLLKIINIEPAQNVKKRKPQEIVKTEEDILTKKYLSESKEARIEHKKFKFNIIDKIIKTSRKNLVQNSNKSMFQLTNPKLYDILRQDTPSSSSKLKYFRNDIKRQTRTTHFYSQTKKKLITEKIMDEEIVWTPKKQDKREFTYIDFMGSQKKNKFLNSHRKAVKYCSDLAKNEESILSIVKYGSKDYDSMKRCFDIALER